MSRLKKAPSEKVEETKRNLSWISYSKGTFDGQS
jgi:hypothetical protein